MLYLWTLSGIHNDNSTSVRNLLSNGDIGYFQLQYLHNRHLLITPDGKPFFALGLNHISVALDKAVINEDSNGLQRIWDDLHKWGFTNCGYGCPDSFKSKMPFFESIRLLSNGHYLSRRDFSFDDVFSHSFKAKCTEKIKAICSKHRENPFLIGYYWTDTPRWDLATSRRKHGLDWVSYLRNLDAKAAGKKAYVEFLRSRYLTIDSLNTIYGIHFRSFESLYGARFDHLDPNVEPIKSDDQDFLAVIAEKYYSLAYGQIKNHDPNHLIFGDKYLANDHPDQVLRVAAKYVDAIALQPGPTQAPGPGPGEDERLFDSGYFASIHKYTGKPIIICDHQTSFYTEDFPVTLWHQFQSEQESFDHLKVYLQEVVKTPYLLGYQRCQYIDSYDVRRGLLKQGLIRENGTYHEIFNANLKTLHEGILEEFKKNMN